ncbi:MAG: PrgI family protein [Patescibacteria group bacterium]|nr:PrgI family protein [Patescibacteria group bacterium]
MQFQVPQFIETEDKIIGPLTLRQFSYLAVAGLIVFFAFFVLQTWLWVFVLIIFGSLAATLAFIQINGRPMSVFLVDAFFYMWEPHSYAYQEEVVAEVIAVAAPAAPVLGRRVLPPIPAAPEAKPTPPPAAPTPVVPTTPAVPVPALAPVAAAERAVSGGIKDLWGKLMTTKTAIPRREKPLAGEEKTQEEIKERYEVVHKITGEGELAKRVDYR